MPPNVEECLARATALFEQEFGPPAGLGNRRAEMFFVPGRIEVLGKHTDYAGGRSLLAAMESGVAVVSALNGTDEVRLANADPQFPKAAFPLSPDWPIPIGPWTNYPMTVARRLLRNFGSEKKLRGVDVAFASTLPPAGGMSSSSAIMVASFFALAGPNQMLELPKFKTNIQTAEDLATYLACHENGRSFRDLEGDSGVGTFGGSEDHTAMLCCQPGRLSVCSFCPTRIERAVPLPEDLVFVVCYSGVSAEKTGEALAKYNSVSARARQACALYNAHYQTRHETLADIVRDNASLERQALLDKFARPERRCPTCASLEGQALWEKFAQIPGANDLPGRGLERYQQFVNESEYYVPAAAEALASSDQSEFGRLVDQSHADSQRLLGNIIPEIDWLQQSARQLGAIAASGFGAGFGGSVYAIVRAAEAAEFQRRWEAAYLQEFPQYRDRALWLTTRPAGAARRLDSRFPPA
ncbi:MAG: galactokinase [Chloroflexi bacterium]|nr:galactokinase [Chloroflexota bacterium]